MIVSDTRTIQVWLPADVLCDVVVKPPNEDGQADIESISVAQRGNLAPDVGVWEATALTEDQYDEIDKLAALAFNEEPSDAG